MSGGSVNLAVDGDLSNSGAIAGRSVVALTAQNVQNLGGRITGADVAVQAREDLNDLGGTLAASDRLTLEAGRDLDVISPAAGAQSAQGSRTSVNCWVNAPTESLWRSLKVGRLYGRRFETMRAVSQWLCGRAICNTIASATHERRHVGQVRRHESLGRS